MIAINNYIVLLRQYFRPKWYIKTLRTWTGKTITCQSDFSMAIGAPHLRLSILSYSMPKEKSTNLTPPLRSDYGTWMSHMSKMGQEIQSLTNHIDHSALLVACMRPYILLSHLVGWSVCQFVFRLISSSHFIFWALMGSLSVTAQMPV